VVDDRRFDQLGAVSALLVAALSILYAIAYLVVTPAAQRESDVDAFFRSYSADPTGLRIASICLLVSGLVIGVPAVALAGRLRTTSRRGVSWAAILGVAAGLATAAHGLADLVGLNELADRYETGDAATRAAVTVAKVSPSQVDPRGLATFCAAGLVVLVLGLALIPRNARVGVLGVVLGVDMLVLFLATAVGVNTLVLITGGLASVVLGPIWWVAVASVLLKPETETRGASPAGSG
jgi:hypothetical protein